MTAHKSKMRPLWKDQDIVTFNLCHKDYRFAVMGWCSFLLRPCVEPYCALKYGDRFRIKGEEGEYICRVDDVTLHDDVMAAVTDDNYKNVWPDASLLPLSRVQYLASLQVYSSRYARYVKKHNKRPKVMLIKYSLYADPRE